jgi:RecA/RadA recombinase
MAKEKNIDEIFNKMYEKRLDQMEKRFNITSQELNIPNKTSTGLLTIDLCTGGGIAAGVMMQVSGLEGSAKTTLASTCLGASIRKTIPINLDWDAENAMSDPVYAKACMGFSPHEIFYGPDKRARLYQESILEDFYNSTKSIMRSLPDKMYRSTDKEWFFVFDADKDGRSEMGEWGFTKYNKTLYEKTGRLWCAIERGGPQGLVVCDSYPALITSKMDEEEEDKVLPAMQARAFADNIRKVVGVMKRKGFSILGVNQIRTNPMPSYGQNPEYEPGGNALRFYSSVRLQNRPRSVPKEMFPGIRNGNKTFKFGQEPSVYGKGTDKYHYINVQNTKNKLGTPGIETMTRVWFKDGNGNPHGFDIAFDTFVYLEKTGRIDGSPKKGLKVRLPELEKYPKLDWDEFKLLALAYTDPVLMKRAKEVFKNQKIIPNIRKALFKEIRTKEAYTLLKDDAKPKVQEDLES